MSFVRRSSAVGSVSNESASDKDGLWLPGAEVDEDRSSRSKVRQVAVVALVVACVIAVGVPLGLALASNANSNSLAGRRLGPGPSRHAVMSALSATTDSGSFDMVYELSYMAGQPRSQVNATLHSGSVCQGGVNGCPGPPPRNASDVYGKAIVDTAPYAMVVSASGNTISSVPGAVVRVNSTSAWLELGGYYGLSPYPNQSCSSSYPAAQGSCTSATPSTRRLPNVPINAIPQPGAGSSLKGIMGEVEAALGQKMGPVAMIGLASPTGYLDLTQGEVTGATATGTGTVGGATVTNYKVSLNLSGLLSEPGITSEQDAAIQFSLMQLKDAGYAGTAVTISVDGAGFIRRSQSVTSFNDGSSVTLTGTFSNFGCAGTVIMPGQQGIPQGSSSGPANCTSPESTGTATPSSLPSSTSTTLSPSATTYMPTTTTPRFNTATSTTVPPTTGQPTGTSVPSPATTTTWKN